MLHIFPATSHKIVSLVSAVQVILLHLRRRVRNFSLENLSPVCAVQRHLFTCILGLASRLEALYCQQSQQVYLSSFFSSFNNHESKRLRRNLPRITMSKFVPTFPDSSRLRASLGLSNLIQSDQF